MKVGDLVRHKGDGTVGLITREGGAMRKACLVLFIAAFGFTPREMWILPNDLERVEH